MRGELGTLRHIREAVARLAPRTLPPTLDRLAAATGLPAERLIKLDQNENPYGPSLRVARCGQSVRSIPSRFSLGIAVDRSNLFRPPWHFATKRGFAV